VFQPGSRYHELETAVHEDRDGKVLYKKRRFIPREEEQTVIGEVRIDQGDRFDLIAFQGYGDPTLFWQICDANRVLYPLREQQHLGRLLKITVRQ